MMLMGLIRQKSELKCQNTLRRKLQIMEYYPYKKLIPLISCHQRNYEIRKFTIEFSKDKAKLKREKLPRLEVKLRKLERNLKLVSAIF